MTDPLAPPRFAACVSDDGCDDLSVGMLDRVLADERASAEGFLRVVDDSGEDYLDPATRFAAVQVASEEIPRLLAASATRGR